MRTRPMVWNGKSGWTAAPTDIGEPSLVLYFGTRHALASGKRYEELRRTFSAAHVLGCSTGGQINNNDINDEDISAAAIHFDATPLRLVCRDIGGPPLAEVA